MAKCDTCKHKTTEDGWMVCECCIHEPSMGDRYEPWTNADRIRAMLDEELVDFLWRLNDNSLENVMPFCKNTVECGEKLDGSDITEDMCKKCLLGKLQQPCEEGTV